MLLDSEFDGERADGNAGASSPMHVHASICNALAKRVGLQACDCRLAGEQRPGPCVCVPARASDVPL